MPAMISDPGRTDCLRPMRDIGAAPAMANYVGSCDCDFGAQ